MKFANYVFVYVLLSFVFACSVEEETNVENADTLPQITLEQSLEITVNEIVPIFLKKLESGELTVEDIEFSTERFEAQLEELQDQFTPFSIENDIKGMSEEEIINKTNKITLELMQPRIDNLLSSFQNSIKGAPFKSLPCTDAYNTRVGLINTAYRYCRRNISYLPLGFAFCEFTRGSQLALAEVEFFACINANYN